MTVLAPPTKPTQRAPMRVLASWALTDWAGQPYYTLVVLFLFGPYFANTVVGDPVRGQALWGYANAAAGALIAVGGPLLGAFVDRRGALKPWVAFFSIIFVAGLLALWLAVPGATPLVITQVLFCFVAATVAVEFTTIFINAMMPRLVRPHELGRLSGMGWAVGYLGGLVALALMAGLIVAHPVTGKTLFGLEPVLALDATSREGDRLVGPFAAAWYVIFMIPFFLFVPDVRPATPLAPGERHTAWGELLKTTRLLSAHRYLLLFFIAYMFFIDGLSAIFAFGGIYGASVFGWGALELGIFGIVVMFVGVFGALIGGVLDDRIGSVAVILISLALLLVGLAGVLSVDKTQILYSIDVPPKELGSSPFSSLGEKVFLLFSMLMGLVAAPLQASSRTLCARLAPHDKLTQFFGLFAFSGKVTAFLAPFVVALVTTMTGDQRLGVASIAPFLVVGFLLMLPIKARH